MAPPALVLLLGLACGSALAQDLFLRTAYPLWRPRPVHGHPGTPLLLSSCLREQHPPGCRHLAAVTKPPFADRPPSYSGFLTVHDHLQAHLYFWFFPALYDYETAPVLLWLQGGPGSSSLFGLFTEVGPFSVSDDNYTLVNNPYSWHKNHSLIFVDNPVGTGFSFTKNESGYATNQTQVGNDLYLAMVQFFTIFSELQSNDFYIVGESYAGKYVPALAHTIHKRNPSAELKINMKGIVVGNGFTDPETTLHYSELVFQLGLVDSTTRDHMKVMEDACRRHLNKGEMLAAFADWNIVLGLFLHSSRYRNLYNFVHEKEADNSDGYISFLQNSEVREALHVGDAEYTSLGEVYYKMVPSFMESVKPWLQELIDNDYRVVYYNGQMDIIVAYPLSVRLYESLQFKEANYTTAERKPWYVEGALAGYSKTVGNFTELLVRNAGHMVPTDQPAFALDLITRVTSGTMW